MNGFAPIDAWIAAGHAEELVPVCGPKHDCECPGKIPHIKGWRTKSFRPQEFRSWPNLGLRTRKYPAIDIDVEDAAIVAAVEDVARQLLGVTARRSRSNSPRCALLYKLEGESFPKATVKFTAPDGQPAKIEVLADGQQLVVAGMHASDVPLEWNRETALAGMSSATRDEFLIAVCSALQSVDCRNVKIVKPEDASSEPEKAEQEPKKASPSHDGTPFDMDAAVRLAAAYLDTIRSAVSGDNGHDQTWEAALKIVRGYGLGTDRGFDLLWDKYNPRCRPPWDEKELRHKVEDAAGGRIPWGCLLNAARPLTDSGNAERFAAEHGADVRYCRPLKKWLVWNGKQWKPDDTGEVERRAKETLRTLYRDAADIEDEKVRDATVAWARKSEAAPRREAMLQLARSEPGIYVLPADLDADSYKFNVENGTIDLRTGELREHRREDLITKIAPVVYDPSAADCPTWVAFLARVVPDKETRDFLQRAIGYSLTGDPVAEALFFLYGKGANGKSTAIGAVQEMHGDYARSVNPELLLASRNDGGANRASPDMIVLRGTRLAVCAETEEGRTLSAAMVKRTSSTDKITARQLHTESCEFPPSHKLFLMTNHRPRVRSADAGTWRRIFLIPFNVTIPEPAQDKSLREKLRAELPGILAWAVSGCLDWQRLGGGRTGLAAPECVLNATKEYREEEDVVAPFLSDCCTLEPLATITKGALYEAYRLYAERNKETPEGSRTFHGRIGELDGVKDSRTGEARGWAGIGLRGKS